MRILVTAGPTREPLDPVRFLSNRSSGRMGYALAAAARAAGHETVLVSGPVCLAPPEGVDFVAVETAREMHEAVASRIGGMDAAVFCAAVADYRPEQAAPGKIKKGPGERTLRLVPNPDILGSARGEFGFRGVLVGFAAETGDLDRNAREKLSRKGCDLLVANEVGRPGTGFDSEDNEVVLFHRDGRREPLPEAPKRTIAAELIARIEALHGGA